MYIQPLPCCRFDDEARNLGLHVSWTKTKIQNILVGGALPALSVGANTVESVNDFVYLGSKISSDGSSTAEVTRCIALAASAMNQLGKVWEQGHLLLPQSFDFTSLVCSQYFCTALRLGPF